MRNAMASVQLLLMRLFGIRKLHHAIDSRLALIEQGVTSRLDALLAGMEDRDRATNERIDTLRRDIGDQLSRQGGADTDRGEAVTNTLKDMREQLSFLSDVWRDQSATRALGEIRAEISGLRADSAQDTETRVVRAADFRPASVSDAIGRVENGLSGVAAQATWMLEAGSRIENALNGLENAVTVVRMQTEEALAAERRRDRLDLLHHRAALVGPSGAATSPAAGPEPHSLPESLRKLEARAPLNFAAWRRLFATGEEKYEERSAADLSVDWHREAFLFRRFLQVHAAGRILDIGVGPLAIPSYLRGIPLDRIAGLDPLPPFEPHPFPFAQTVAEFLPWPDASFETAVAATSLDHVYLLDVAMDEVRRVLAPGGIFIVWSGMLPRSAPYDPYDAAIEPPDAFHLFHPGENWFVPFMSRWFKLRERLDVATNNAFFAFERV